MVLAERHYTVPLYPSEFSECAQATALQLKRQQVKAPVVAVHLFW